MLYKLKPNQEPFVVCGGPFEGRKFLTGQTYAEIPPEEADRFDETEPVIESSGLGKGVVGSSGLSDSTTQRPNRPKDLARAPKEE
jgi:hypothetical protein